MIKRGLEAIVKRWLFRNKVIIIYGARQVGKTTLVKSLLAELEQEDGYYNCEIQSIRNVLAEEEPSVLKRFLGNKRIVVFDEAQNIPNIGRILKLLTDTFPEMQVIATGSSSFELANQTSEPLTGRALQFILYPFSYRELQAIYSPFELDAQIDNLLKYGLYPEIVQAPEEDAQLLLDDLSSKYLYKDVLEFENLKRADIIFKLLQLLALQIGSEVSLNELANTLQTNKRTVERYIDLLEKAFVIFRLRSFSRNLRKEISKKYKVYFFDIGIRNSIIRQYQDIDVRLDKGALWENFLIVERMKYLQYSQMNPNVYFWRTHDKKEIDYLEEYNGQLTGYELKWKIKKKRIPEIFINNYPNSSIEFIDRTNFTEFICT